MIQGEECTGPGNSLGKGPVVGGSVQCLGGCEVSVVAVEGAGTRGRLAWPGGARTSRAWKERSGCGEWREGAKEWVVV